MNRQQEFWEKLKFKYEEKNRSLQQREQDLRLKLEAMNALIGDMPKKVPEPLFTAQDPQASQSEIKDEQIIRKHLSKNILLEHPEFRSCLCQPPEERAGFFKCLFSIFGSKSKASSEAPLSTASPPFLPPPELPTKDIGEQSVNLYQPSENKNCMCNPCEADEKNYSLPKKNSDFCNCSEIMTNNETKYEKILGKSLEGTRNSGLGDACNCSVCDECACVDTNSTNKQIASVPGKMIINKGDVASQDACNCSVCDECACIEVNSINKQIADSPFGLKIGSNMSLKSLDLNYMKNIYELASQQKDLLKQITNLEQKEKIYHTVFNKYKGMDLSSNNRNHCECCTNKSLEEDNKTTAELKLENFLLKNELKEMRLEVRQYLERMEGPMQFKIESERYKCIQLEKKLEEAGKELTSIQELYEKELNSVKLQLCTANTNVYNLNTVKEHLLGVVETLQRKCAKLEDDLIRQKISEAETIKSLQQALNAQVNANVVKDECDLHQIARELSKILKECEPCGECMNLPEDLTTAAQLLKSLTDMVDSKLRGDHLLPKDSAISDAKTMEPQAAYATLNEKESSKTSKSSSPDAEIQKVVLTTTSANALEENSGDKKIGNDDETQLSNPAIDLVQLEDSQQPPKEQDQVNEPQNLDNTEADPENNMGDPISVSQPEDRIPSVKSEQGSTASPPITESLDFAQQQKTIAETEETRNPPFTNPHQKINCKCVKPKKTTEIDQLWPKSETLITVKDSDQLENQVLDEKCDCLVAKNLRAQLEMKNPQVPAKNDKTSCACSKVQDTDGVSSENEIKEKTDIAKVFPSESERFRLSHQVTASKSKDILKSETSVKCLKVKENFPFDIDTQVDVLNKPPDGVHVTTTITNSGTLEVITEGPEGVIETTLVYTNSGNVEVVTEILEYQGKGNKCKRKTPAIEDSNMKAIEAPINPKHSNTAEETNKIRQTKEDCSCKTSSCVGKIEVDIPTDIAEATDEPPADITIDSPGQTGEPLAESSGAVVAEPSSAVVAEPSGAVVAELPLNVETPKEVSDAVEEQAPNLQPESGTGGDCEDTMEVANIEPPTEVGKEDPAIVKSLSLSMHVESQEDIENMAGATTEDHAKD